MHFLTGKLTQKTPINTQNIAKMHVYQGVVGWRGMIKIGMVVPEWYMGRIWPQKNTCSGRRKTPVIEIIRQKNLYYFWLEKLPHLKHNKNACQISLCGWRDDERVVRYDQQEICCVAMAPNTAMVNYHAFRRYFLAYIICYLKLLPKTSTNSIYAPTSRLLLACIFAIFLVFSGVLRQFSVESRFQSF